MNRRYLMKLYRTILPAVAALLLPAFARAEVQVTPVGPGTYEVQVDGRDAAGNTKVYRFQVAGDAGAAAGAADPDRREAEIEALEEEIEAKLEAHEEAVEEVEEAYEDTAEEAGDEGAVAAPMPPLPPLPPIPELVELPEDLQERVRERVAEAQQRAEEAQARMAEIQGRLAQAQARVAEAQGGRADDVVVMGNSVTVESGRVVNDVVALGGTVTVLSGAVVRGDAVALGGTVELQPGVVVRGDVAAFGGSVVVRSGAVVRGDASSFGGSVEVEEGAIVQGSRVGLGPGGAFKQLMGGAAPEEAEHAGEVEIHEDDTPWIVSALLTVLWKTVQFLVVAVVGLILIATVPRRMDRMRRPLAESPGKAFLAGLLAMVAFVPLVVLLALSIIGILLIPLLVLAYVVLFFTGWSVAGMVLGGKSSLVSRHTPAMDLLVGLGLFWAVGLFAEIPWIGWIGALLLTVASLMGMGAVVLARFGNQPKPAAGNMHPPPEQYAEEASGY